MSDIEELRQLVLDPDSWMESDKSSRFQYFDPYATYSNPDNAEFISPIGKPLGELNADSEALFVLGAKVYSRLPQVDCKEEFESGYAGFLMFLKELRQTFCEMFSSGQLVPQNGKGEKIPFDPQMIDDLQVISICWQLDSGLGLLRKSCKDSRSVFTEMFLFHALREIDDSLIGIELDGRGAVVAAVEATNALSNAIAISAGDERLIDARKLFAYEAAIARIKRDPKQKEKAFVRECWERWALKGESSYKSKAAFARDMLDKCEHLESQKKIEDWCREWEKTGTQPAQ